MSGLRLRNLSIGVRLCGVNQIGKFDAVPNEKYGHVVADQIKHAFTCVELDRKAAYVTYGVGGATRTHHRRKSGKHSRALTRLQKICARDIGRCAIGLEYTVRTSSAGVDNTLWDAFVIKVRDLFAKVEVLHQCGPTSSRSERIVGLRKPHTLGRGEEITVLCGHLAGSWCEHRRCCEVGNDPAPRSLLFCGGLGRVCWVLSCRHSREPFWLTVSSQVMAAVRTLDFSSTPS